MTNHYHLMIETPEANLVKGMRQLNGVFTQRSNRRHGRSGHLFQGRYKAILVDRDAYFLELARYIVLNPVRAAVVRQPQQWQWSSYGATAGRAKRSVWLFTDSILKQFGNSRARARQSYEEFVKEGVGKETIWKDLQGQIYLGDNEFVEAMQSKRTDADNDINIPRQQRRTPPLTLSTIRRRYAERDEAIRAAYETGAYSYQAIAKHFGLHFTTVGRIVRGR